MFFNRGYWGFDWGPFQFRLRWDEARRMEIHKDRWCWFWFWGPLELSSHRRTFIPWSSVKDLFRA